MNDILFNQFKRILKKNVNYDDEKKLIFYSFNNSKYIKEKICNERF